MNPNVYNIDWYIYLLWHIETALQQDRYVTFIKAALAPVRTLHNDFLVFMTYVRTILHTNGQTCKLRGALNNNFDPSARRITIANTPLDEILYVYTAAENNPQYLPKYLSDHNGVLFVVTVPIALQGSDAAIRRFIDTYKLPTTQYLIIYV